jgi:type IV pilus assembly protein PilA
MDTIRSSELDTIPAPFDEEETGSHTRLAIPPPPPIPTWQQRLVSLGIAVLQARAARLGDELTFPRAPRVPRVAKRAFTLIELMIVVAIVGVLAVLAIYGVRKYIASAKTAEARNSLGQMSKDATRAFNEEAMGGSILTPGTSAAVSHTLCQSGSASVPSAPNAIKGKKYKSTSAEWAADQGLSQTGFACLRFHVDDPQYYQYTYAAVSPGNVATNSWTGTANGDLNGDGVLSTFTITGSLGADLVLNNAPNLVSVNEDE